MLVSSASSFPISPVLSDVGVKTYKAPFYKSQSYGNVKYLIVAEHSRSNSSKACAMLGQSRDHDRSLSLLQDDILTRQTTIIARHHHRSVLAYNRITGMKKESPDVCLILFPELQATPTIQEDRPPEG
jgi:hypothetical protein